MKEGGIYIADILSKTFSAIGSAMRSPVYALAVLVIVLFFPLDLVDYLIWVLIAGGSVIINTIIWVLVGIVNAMISIINWIIEKACNTINAIDFLDIGEPDPFPNFPYIRIKFEDIVVDVFSSGTCLFTIILALVGISLPIW